MSHYARLYLGIISVKQLEIYKQVYRHYIKDTKLHSTLSGDLYLEDTDPVVVHDTSSLCENHFGGANCKFMHACRSYRACMRVGVTERKRNDV